MSFTLAQIERSRSDTSDVWTFGNSILYRMCEENPEHKEFGIVAGKLLLIGRSYGAAVERRRVISADTKRVSTDEFYNYIAAKMIESNLDGVLMRVREHGEFSREGLRVTLEAHQFLISLLQPLTNQRNRSLASKYLHFHAPAQVPIFDNIASGELFRLMSRHRLTAEMDNQFDALYERFSLLLLDLREEIKNGDRDGARLTPRELDRLLLQSAAERKIKKQQSQL